MSEQPITDTSHDQNDPVAVHMFRGATGGALCAAPTGGVSSDWGLVTCTTCRQIDVVSS